MSEGAERSARGEQHRQAVVAGVLAHARRLRWPAPRLEAERQHALRSLLAFAMERSPFHAGRLAGMDVAGFTEAELPLLPVMTKEDMVARFSEVVTDPRLTTELVDRHLVSMDGGADEYLLDRYRVITSSGSSGLRGSYVYDWDAWTTLGLMASRSRLAMIDGSPRPPGSATVSLFGSGTTTLSSAMSSFLASSEDPFIHLPMSMATPALAETLEKVQPVVLQAYPTALDLLIHEAKSDRLQIAPRYVESGGELLSERTRADVREVWGTEIDDCWGLSEGIYAFSCPAGPGMHLPDDLVIVEPVDLDGHPVLPGEPAAKLYITNLYNHAQPLIRFEVADGLTVFEGPCTCGSAHRRIDALTGRHDLVFRYGDGIRVYPMALAFALESERGLIEYQVRQTPRGVAVRAVLEPSVRIESLRERLLECLDVAGLVRPEVTIEPVGRIDRLPSGKLRQFIASPEGHA
ncbi:MAG: phenylacetate--CoA ligase family protein [Acidimicrobiales bacterium]